MGDQYSFGFSRYIGIGQYISLADMGKAYRLSVKVIGIGRYEKYYIDILSVLADKKIEFICLYRYRPIRKKAYRSPTVYDSKNWMNVETLDTNNFCF